MTGFCAGIVTYEPDVVRLKKNLSRVARQVDGVYIVDNHSSIANEIRQLLFAYDNVELIENDRNYGIAKALNQMCEIAVERGYSWILTLDQDTVVSESMIELFKPYTDDLMNGIICPAVYYEGWGKKPEGIKNTQYVYACMTSASLTQIEAWRRVGGFRENYFIDYVDNEFCMKLGLNHYKILRVNAVQISHQLGESGTKKVMGFKIRYSRHSPLRLYYMARNNYAFIREYRAHLSVFKEILKMNYVLAQGILFSDKRKEAIRFVKRGISDAKKEISGEYQA